MRLAEGFLKEFSARDAGKINKTITEGKFDNLFSVKSDLLEKIVKVFKSAKGTKDGVEPWKKKVKTLLTKELGQSSSVADEWIKYALGRVK